MSHETQEFCRHVATTLCHNLKFRIRQIDAIRMGKNDSHYQVYINELGQKSNRGSFQGCCKWGAIFSALIEYEEEITK